jgi:mycothiol synthase
MSRADWSANRTVRPAAIEDVDRAVEMFNARSRAFYGVNQSTAAEMRSWWSSPRVDLAGGTRVVLDGAGRMVAWAHVAEPTDPCVQIGVGVIVHPDDQADEAMWDGLFRWAVEKARTHVERAPSGARVTATESALDYDEARRGAAERAGFRPVRVQNIMRIDLESEPPAPVWPEGIRVRTADIEADLRGIVAADIEAFRDHWGHVERPFESELEEWQRYVEGEGDRCDPTLWFLAVDGEEIVGYSICRPQVADDETRGYVDGLCVRPAWRKRGIALALLHKTFGEFYRRGKAAVELDMDSENLTGALRLYERAGMRVIRRTLNYELVLRDGEDLVTRELRA